jgi:hypothetical protein
MVTRLISAICVWSQIAESRTLCRRLAVMTANAHNRRIAAICTTSGDPAPT